MAEVRPSSTELDRYASARVAQAESEAEEAGKKERQELEEAYTKEISRLKDEYVRSSNSERSKETQEREKLRQSLYDQKGRLQNEAQIRERKHLAEQVEQVQKGYEKLAEKADDSANVRAREATLNANEKIGKEIQKTKDSHEREVRGLKGDIEALQGVDEKHRKGSVDTSGDLIRSMEIDQRAKVASLEKTRQTELDASARRLKETETYLAHQGDDRVKEQTRNSTQMVRGMQLSADEERKMLEKEFDKNLAQRDLLLKKEKGYWSERVSQINEEGDKRSANALLKQHEQYARYAEDQTKSNNATVERLENQLQTIKTTANPKEVSSAAENAIRTSMVKEQEKVDAADRQSRLKADAARSENDRRRYEETLNTFQARTTDLTREKERALQTQKSMLTGQLADEQRAKEDGFRVRDEKADQLFERQNRMHADDLSEQRKHYEDTFNVLKDTSISRIQSVKQEAENREKLLKREFSYQMTSSVRDYEKRLSDQKRDYDAILKETRLAADKAVRENERKTKNFLEEYTRNYEARFAQEQVQQKERERTLSESFQDQIDKMKQSNALQLQKALEKKS